MISPPFLFPSTGGAEVFTQERCYIAELFNDPCCPDTSLARARVKPGVTTQLHALRDTQEIYFIEAGQGLVEIDGVLAHVGPGDRVNISRGAAQRITNAAEVDLIFLCLCSPRFVPKAYVVLGP